MEGTGSIYKRTDVTRYVQQALDAGFSHVDTAQGYVGTAIHESGLARSEFYVTTKYSRGAIPVDESIRSSLSQLGLKFVDLYLIHQAWVTPDIVATWRDLEGVQKAGLAKSIGVSNFPLPVLQKLFSDPTVTVLPVVNQIELHPYNYAAQREVVEWSQERGVVIEAYGGLSSLTKYPGGPVDVPVASAAVRLGISPTQVLLGWLRAKGVVVVTTTSNKQRLEEYLAAGDLRPLPASDVAAIDAAGAQGPPTTVRLRLALTQVAIRLGMREDVDGEAQDGNSRPSRSFAVMVMVVLLLGMLLLVYSRSCSGFF
ncbi:Aldo/keto reductase [Mycena amicta]|nr:Aldo/keto reductase [Mycena amicta]